MPPPFITLGLVSNTLSAWPEVPIAEKCRRAVEAGFGYVELRQRSLGALEEAVAGDPRPWPIPSRFAELAAAFPELGFNLAAEAPFLTEPLRPDDPYLARCAQAAAALGGKRPVLRLVDVTPPLGALEHEEAIDEFGASVCGLARSCWRHGTALALENSHQPLLPLRAVIRRAAFGLPEEVPIPQVCWDPQNQIRQRFADEDPVEAARRIDAREWFMVHFKHEEGDLDWPGILAGMRERGYRGPGLFELKPGPDAWERLQAGTEYILGVIRDVTLAIPDAADE